MDYDIIPTKDLYDLLLRREEHLANLKKEYEFFEKITKEIRHIAVLRRNGKSQMEFNKWDESKAKSNWEKILE